jgi:hypothetical protein
VKLRRLFRTHRLNVLHASLCILVEDQALRNVLHIRQFRDLLKSRVSNKKGTENHLLESQERSVALFGTHA